MRNKQLCLLHQFLNKAVSLLIVFIIVITLSGCSLPWNQKQISETTISATEDNADFTEYVNNLFADLLSADMVSLHAYVEHPRDFGINDYDILSYAKMIVMATLVVRDMDAARFYRNGGKFTMSDRIDVARIFSKEVEHSEGNAQDLKEMCMMEEIAKVDALCRQI